MDNTNAALGGICVIHISYLLVNYAHLARKVVDCYDFHKIRTFMKTKQTFESLLNEFGYRYDARTVFDDFLTMVLCSFSQNPATGKSHDEDLYLKTIERYKTDTIRHHFPKMLTCLTFEMEERLDSSEGSDVLGEFYEQNLYLKGASQYFTPWSVCSFMTKISTNESSPTYRPLRILDPSCGSGRMLLTAGKNHGLNHEYYGIDIDHTCVKMAAINLFLHGMFHCEVMCGDALSPNDYRGSYRISFLPFGIFRITEREQSPLWRMHVSSFEHVKEMVKYAKPEIVIQDAKDKATFGSQLKFF